MTVRAKFKCVLNQKNEHSDTHDVRFEAVTSDTPENKTWAKYTPAGHMGLQIDNPNAVNAFEVGKSYFLDITPAD